MDKWILAWLWVSCALACFIDFWQFESKTKRLSIKIAGGLVVAIIGPPLSASFLFSHILRWMANHKDA